MLSNPLQNFNMHENLLYAAYALVRFQFSLFNRYTWLKVSLEEICKSSKSAISCKKKCQSCKGKKFQTFIQNFCVLFFIFLHVIICRSFTFYAFQNIEASYIWSKGTLFSKAQKAHELYRFQRIKWNFQEIKDKLSILKNSMTHHKYH